MSQGLSRSARKVQDVLSALGIESQVVELPATTRTAADAAAAIGCSVAQIAKSLLFRTVNSKEPVMVIAAGTPNSVVKLGAQHLREITGGTVAEIK